MGQQVHSFSRILPRCPGSSCNTRDSWLCGVLCNLDGLHVTRTCKYIGCNCGCGAQQDLRAQCHTHGSSVSGEDHESDLRIDLRVPDPLALDAQFVEARRGDVGQCPIDEVADARVLRFERKVQLVAPE